MPFNCCSEYSRTSPALAKLFRFIGISYLHFLGVVAFPAFSRVHRGRYSLLIELALFISGFLTEFLLQLF